MKYIVSYRTSRSNRWFVWKEPVDSPSETVDMAREIWDKEINDPYVTHVDVRIARVKESDLKK